MELRAEDISVPQPRHHFNSIVRDCRDIFGVRRDDGVAVNEVEIGVLGHMREQRLLSRKLHVVPANMRDAQFATQVAKVAHTAVDQSQSGGVAMLLAFADQHLHSQADTQQRLAIDLGEVLTEQLSLSLNPYPRAPGASFAAINPGEQEEGTPATGPFAALAGLKVGRAAPRRAESKSAGKPRAPKGKSGR